MDLKKLRLDLGRFWALAIASLLLVAAGVCSASAVPLELVGVTPDRAPLAGTSMVEVTLRNAGEATLSDQEGLHLEAVWRGPDGVPIHDWTVDERSRYGLGDAVAPGATLTLEIPLRAVVAGRHTLTLDLVRGGEKNPVQTLTAGVIARGQAMAWAVWLVVLLVVAAVASRRYVDRWPGVAQGVMAFVPVLAVWAAAVITQKMFSEITGLPLHDEAQRLIYGSSALSVLVVALFPSRFRNGVAAGVVAALVFLAFADIVHQRAFGSIVSMASLASAGQLPAVRASVAELTHASDASLLIVLLSGAVLPFFGRLPEARRSLDRIGRVVCLVLALIFAMSVPIEVDRMVKGHFGLRVYHPGAIVARLGLHSAHVFDLRRALRERGLRGDLSDADRRGVIEYFRARDKGRERGAAFGAASGHDLIVVQAEALQEWVIDLEVGGALITPFLNSLATRGLYFPNVLDQTREGNTSDAEYLVLNSQHPLPSGAIAFRRESNDFITLAHVLADQGYAALSAHPGVPGFWNRAHLHPRYGFKETLFAEELGPGPVIGWGLADEVFLDRMLDRVLDKRQPYFAFLVTMGLHHPFDTFPDELKEMSIGPLEGTRLGNYLHGVRHFDTSARKLFEGLEKAGRLDSTVVAIYGDHDARLEMSPALLQLVGERWDPSLGVRLDRVPFFVHAPAASLAGRMPRVGGQIDVAPTLLGLLGIDTPACFAGHSLLSGGPAWAARADGVVMDGQRVFVPAGRHIPREGACFNYPGGGMRPVSDCQELIRDGHVEASASVFLANHDLARSVMEDPG